MSTPLITNSLEIWKIIPGWPNYRVSNLGRVKRIACWSEKGNRRLKERFPNIIKDRGRGAQKKYVYCYVNLGTASNHEAFSVARLVLIAFVGMPAHNQECRHLDDNSENCVLSNLAWGTRIENRADGIRNGVLAIGERNGGAKLTAAIVLKIRQEYIPYSRSFGATALAKKYGVKLWAILEVIKKVTWKHV